MKGSDLGLLVLVLLILLLSLWLQGCQHATVEGDHISVHTFGKGCAVIERDERGQWKRLVLEGDGISNPLAGTLRGLVSSAAAVFGSRGEDHPSIEAGEGCAGVLDVAPSGTVEGRKVIGELVEPHSPREALR